MKVLITGTSSRNRERVADKFHEEKDIMLLELTVISQLFSILLTDISAWTSVIRCIIRS